MGRGTTRGSGATLLVRLLFALTFGLMAARAAAQAVGDGPPLPQTVLPDSAGVDLLNGRRVGTDSTISIGSKDTPSLEIAEGSGGLAGTPASGFHYMRGYYPSFYDQFFFAGREEHNRSMGALLTDGSIQGNENGPVVYDKTGSKWKYAATPYVGYVNSANPDYYLTTITRPDGEVLTYNYTSPPNGGDARGLLRSIVSSAGYQLQFEWALSGGYWSLSKVTTVNRRYQYCDPLASSCPNTAYNWPYLAWTRSASGTTIDSSGLKTVFHGLPQQGAYVGNDGAGHPMYEWSNVITTGSGVTRTYTTRGTAAVYDPPAFGSASYGGSPSIDAARIWRVQTPTATWTYNYPSAGSDYLIRTAPDGGQSTRNGSTLTDELGRPTSYVFRGAFGSPGAVGTDIRTVQKVTFPEGNQATYSFDDLEWTGRVNLQSITLTPKPGSTEPTLTWTRNFPGTCSGAQAVYCNKPSYEIDAKGNRTDYTYDPVHGGILTKTLPPDASGVRPQVRYAYQQLSARVLNSAGQLINEAPIWRLVSMSSCRTQASCAGTADEVVTVYTYDDNLLLASETVRAGDGSVTSTTSRTYDPIGNVATVDGPQPGTGDTTRYVYDALRRLVATMEPDPDGPGPLPVPVTRVTYNGDDQPTLVETGRATDQSDAALVAMTVDRQVVTAYDADGRKQRESTLLGGATQTVTQYSYEAAGRLECTAVRMNPAAFGALPASACTLGTQGTAGPDRITRNVYDLAGQLKIEQRAYGTGLQQNYASYAYSGNGKRTSVTDANGNVASMTFDGLDRQVRWNLPSPTAAGFVNPADYEQYSYDLNGNRTSLRKRDGTTITYAYDGLDRMIQKSVPTSASGGAGYSVFYGYDLRGLQTYARFSSASGPGITNNWDSLGRLTSTSTTVDGTTRTISSQYDADGSRNQLTSSAGYYLQFSYDAGKRMKAIQEAGAVNVVQLGYDALGHHSNLVFGPAGASTATYGYDGLDRLISIGHDLAGTAYDQNLGFGYNAASQIVTRTSGNDAYASNTAYDVSRAYAVNGLNQYTAAGGATFAYDGNGNLTSDGATSFVYDGENRLVSASGAKSATLSYDPLGRLWQIAAPSGTTRFEYDGDKLLQEYSAAGTLLRVYGYGPGADHPFVWYELAGGPVRRYLHADQQGSIVSVNDDNGTALAIDGYDAWGIPNAANQGRFQYTGQAWLGELGMYYYKARIYSPTLGRFLQTDPVGYNDQINLYTYVGNDPMDRGDPSGLRWEYNQRSGEMVHVDDRTGERSHLANGYSGHGDGVNNPGMQDRQGTGPLPTGTYTIGTQRDNVTGSGHRLRGSERLTPAEGNDMHGRSGFLIHGDNRRGNQSASEGCIILDRASRNAIGRSDDRTLVVVAGQAGAAPQTPAPAAAPAPPPPPPPPRVRSTYDLCMSHPGAC